MKVGMLWFDNDPKVDMMVKINRAVDYYQHKYGTTPNLCFVHPSMVKTNPAKSATIEVRSSRSVLPNHFWIGLNATSP